MLVTCTNPLPESDADAYELNRPRVGWTPWNRYTEVRIRAARLLWRIQGLRFTVTGWRTAHHGRRRRGDQSHRLP